MVTITGYIKFMVEEMPLDMFAYPIRRVIDVMARSILSTRIFHVSEKELSRSDFFLHAAYIISTMPAINHLYESTSKLLSPAARSPKLNKGEKPKDADESEA